MTPAARQARTTIFATFASEGHAPSPAEIAERLGLTGTEVAAALDELHDAHAIVLSPARDSIRMAHPFSAHPMGFVVRAQPDRLWWGGCAWDSFGIAAALGEPVEILTTCPGCGRSLTYGSPPGDTGLVVRIPKPAREWWDDVVHTCTHIRTFCSEDHVGDRPGQTVPLEQLHRLAIPWYGDRLDPGWKPRPVEESQRILDATGLSGPFWELP